MPTAKAPQSFWQSDWSDTIGRWSDNCSRGRAAGSTVRIKVWRLAPWVEWAKRKAIGPNSPVTPALVEEFGDALWHAHHARTHPTLSTCKHFYEWLSGENLSAEGKEIAAQSNAAFTPTLVERYRILNRKSQSFTPLHCGAQIPGVLPALLRPYLDQANRCLPTPVGPQQFMLWLSLLGCGVHLREMPSVERRSLMRKTRAVYLQLPPGRLLIADKLALAAWSAHYDDGDEPDCVTQIRKNVPPFDAPILEDALSAVISVYSTPRGVVAAAA